MKCEICHKREAETALRRSEDDELYVCGECARQERARRQKKSQRTRKVTGLPPGVSMSVTQIGGNGEEPPPIVEAIMNAFQGMVSDLEKSGAESGAKREPQYRALAPERADHALHLRGLMHLEGLHLIGEMEAVHRALRALEMRLVGVDADGVRESAHAYRLEYSGAVGPARRTVADLLEQERNARIRLLNEMPRVFGDAICRALAILKNCRLLSSGELFDLLSPLRLAAMEDLLDGISQAELEKLADGLDLSSSEDKCGIEERDRLDAERADAMNRRFEDVVLSDRAEERFM